MSESSGEADKKLPDNHNQKTRFWLKPNLLQMHSSYVITDPKGSRLVEGVKVLQRGATTLGKDGKPVKDEKGNVGTEPYRIQVINTSN